MRDRAKEAARLRKHLAGRKAAIAAIKEASPCEDCGEFYPACVMDFDHVRGEKDQCVSAIAGGAWENVLREIDKCDLVCSNCHRMRTDQRRREAPPVRCVSGNDDKSRLELQITLDLQ